MEVAPQHKGLYINSFKVDGLDDNQTALTKVGTPKKWMSRKLATKKVRDKDERWIFLVLRLRVQQCSCTAFDTGLTRRNATLFNNHGNHPCCHLCHHKPVSTCTTDMPISRKL